MAHERLTLSAGEAPRNPEELEAHGAADVTQLSPLTRLGPVHLTVSSTSTTGA